MLLFLCHSFLGLLYHLIQFDRSQVTGPPSLSKCHTCPRSQVPLMKPSNEMKKISQKICSFDINFCRNFLWVTGHNLTCQIHNFVRPVTGHTPCQIELNGTVMFFSTVKTIGARRGKASKKNLTNILEGYLQMKWVTRGIPTHPKLLQNHWKLFHV